MPGLAPASFCLYLIGFQQLSGEQSVVLNNVPELERAIAEISRSRLAQLPTPLHPLPNFGRRFERHELWIKRDDLTGLEGGGNKTRKLEFLVGDAIEAGADTLVTVGAIQSNHTRQTAAAAAKCALKCALLHFGWTQDAGPHYREVGNILLSSTMGAELWLDETPRPIEDQGPLAEFGEFLKSRGHKPYLIPAGGSEHRLGSLGYIACAVEITQQSVALDIHFDYIVHCTGSSSTQAGLIAGFAAINSSTRVIGVSDDDETVIKRARVLQLANDALKLTGLTASVTEDDVHVVAVDQSPYGKAEPETFAAIRALAKTEGLIADPVYEGKAVRGLISLLNEGRFEADSKILLMHLGGTPAVHAYGAQFGQPDLLPYPA